MGAFRAYVGTSKTCENHVFLRVFWLCRVSEGAQNLALVQQTSRSSPKSPKLTPKWSPKGTPKGVKKGPKYDLLPKSPKVTQNGPKMDPKWSPNGAQMLSKWCQNGAKISPKWVKRAPKPERDQKELSGPGGALRLSKDPKCPQIGTQNDPTLEPGRVHRSPLWTHLGLVSGLCGHFVNMQNHVVLFFLTMSGFQE